MIDFNGKHNILKDAHQLSGRILEIYAAAPEGVTDTAAAKNMNKIKNKKINVKN